jgi:hypothetical protein
MKLTKKTNIVSSESESLTWLFMHGFGSRNLIVSKTRFDN